LLVGDATINKYAQMFGYGQPTLVDLPMEKGGWLSGEEEYNRRYGPRGWRWTRGLVLDLAIGQAQLVTPIQMACMVGGLGNATNVYRPRLVREIRRDGKPVKIISAESNHEVKLSQDVVAIMHKAMVEAIEPGGTGGRARVENVPVGGKTGSAQNPHSEITHGLFIGCAPVDNPAIAVAVVVENAGHGGTVAAPIAGEVLRYYFANTPEGKEIAARYADQKQD
jgi:penicillin-binding protein 2